MGYVEWLRVRGCLKWTAIVLGVLFLICVIVRLALIGRQDYTGWALGLKSDPGSKVTETALPDGTRRMAIDDPAKQVRVVVYDRGWQGKRIEIYDLSERGSSDLKHAGVTMGSVHVSKLPGHGSLTVVDTNGETDFVSYVINGMIIAFICATALGAPFAREGDGHLEVSLTKPISRERYAATALAIDVAGVAAAFLLGTAFSIVVHALFEIPHIVFGPRDLLAIGVGVFAPIAWYSMLTAATASLRRGYGAVLGFAWPVAGIVLALSFVQPNGNALLTVVHGIAWALSFFDPLTYASLHGGGVHVGGPLVFRMGFGRQALALLVLTLLYAIVSLLQWRRIEA